MKKFVAMAIAVLALNFIYACGDDDDDDTSAEQGQVVLENGFEGDSNVAIISAKYSDVSWDKVLKQGEKAEVVDVTPVNDYAYALLIFGYQEDGENELPLVVRTKDKVETIADEEMSIVFSFASHYGKCSCMTETEYNEIHDKYFKDTEVQKFADVGCPETATCPNGGEE